MTDKQNATDKPADPVEVTLLAPHTHQGVDYEAGAKLKLRTDQAKRLIEAKRAQ
ncbi:MAG: DUF7210 family protein [Pseudomonadota bacterium]